MQEHYNFDFMEDCIHLKACRRIQVLARKQGGQCARLGRLCNENCTAYVGMDDDTKYVTVKTAVRYAQSGADAIRGGYGEYDVYAPEDLERTGKTLLQLLNGEDE